MLNLAERLLDDKQDMVRWFHYGLDEDGNLERVDDMEEALVSWQIRFMQPHQQREFISASADKGTTKKAASRNSIAKLLGSSEKSLTELARTVLENWRLTVRGAYALRAQIDFAGLAPDTEIPFTDDNIGAMIERSLLRDKVVEDLGDYEAWHTLSEEDLEGNSGSGPSLSSAG